MKKLFNKYSSSGQDIFAYQIGGSNGTYLEIGGADAIKGSNTYSLEKEHGWKGVSLELNKNRHIDSWNTRTNKIYWENALTCDYTKILRENNITDIDYLQVDIEPASNTFEALLKVLEQNIKFKCCTFEHDSYRRKKGDKDYKKLADKVMKDHGYKIAVENVISRKNKKYYETWYVANNINWQQKDFEDWQKEVEVWIGYF